MIVVPDELMTKEVRAWLDEVNPVLESAVDAAMPEFRKAEHDALVFGVSALEIKEDGAAQHLPIQGCELPPIQ